MRKPSLNPNPGANRYASDGERIAEFSFPLAATPSGDLPGGLLSLRYREGKPPLVCLYRVEGCEIATDNSSGLNDVVNAAFAVVDADGSPEDAIAALAATLAKHFPEG